MSDFFNSIRLGMDNNRLSSLLIAILTKTGPVTLTREEAAKEQSGGQLHYAEDPATGELTISLEPIREREV
jgi:hypothetical protein